MGTDRLQPAMRMWRSMLFEFLMKSQKACVIVISSGMQKNMKKDNMIDTCVIRTHAPEGIALAGQRVNHSAKVPLPIRLMLIDDRMFVTNVYIILDKTNMPTTEGQDLELVVINE
jgi:hypothetical protein